VGGQNEREFVYYPGTFELLAIIDKTKTINLVHTDSVGLPHGAGVKSLFLINHKYSIISA